MKTRMLFVVIKKGDFKGEVNAIINDNVLPMTMPQKVDCYAHVGQHSTATPEWIEEYTRVAKRGEYNDLLNELKSIYEDVEVANEIKVAYSNEKRFGYETYVERDFCDIVNNHWKVKKRVFVDGYVYTRW